MAAVQFLTTTLFAVILASGTAEDGAEIHAALASDETCAGHSCGLELRQLRGEKGSLEKDDGSCKSWMARVGCDAHSEVLTDESTDCGDDCSRDTCCESKSSCDFFTVMDGCAKLAVPANVTMMVWTAKESDDEDEDMYCATAQQDATSCGKSCCELKPCTECSGQQFTNGCQAGNKGVCADCPTESSCASGQKQKCGEGVLSSCSPCTNAPKHAVYTGSSMTRECPWACAEDYNLEGGECVPSKCNTWTGKCDATHIAVASITECVGACSAASCCAPKATCTAYLGNSKSAAATCALVKDAAAHGKVWAPLATGEKLLCKGAETDDASCQLACCVAQSCQSCSGKKYTDGCKAGSIGACSACPTNSSCLSGEYMPCGHGVLGKCQSCTNGPKSSVFTDTALDNACPWDCAEGYNKTGESCTASCSVYTCPKDFVAIAEHRTMLLKAGKSDQMCCQSSECASLTSKTRVTSCSTSTNETDCDANYVLSGNQHLEARTAGAVYTPCAWNAASQACNWESHSYKNCFL